MNNSITNESIWGKLSDMDKKLSKLESAQPIDRPSIEPSCQFSDEPILDKLSEIEQTLAESSIKRHHHSIEIASSWVFLSLMGLSLALLLSLFFHYKQRERIGELSDNDLKYRYIKAFCHTDTVSINHLEDVFTYNRNPQLIFQYRKQVIEHEQQVQIRAEDLEKARLKIEEAGRLTKEVKELRKSNQ